MDADESESSASRHTGGDARRHPDTPHHTWSQPQHRPHPIHSASQLPSPEAFGRGVSENAPEAFGSPDARKREEEKEKKDGDQEKDSPGKDKDKSEKDSKQSEDKKDQKKEDDKKKEDEKPKKPPFYKRPVPMIILGVVLILAIVCGVIYWLYARQFESTDDAFINGHIIAISPNVAATVAKVYIDDNYYVKRGQLLVQLDPRDYQAVVDQMTANLSAAKDRATQANVQLDATRAGITDAQAQVTIAQTNAENAALNYHRYATLSPEARSQQQLDDAFAAHRSADAQVEQAKARLNTAEANAAASASAVTTAAAEIKLAQANLEKAQINLGYCQITAPEDGMITRKDVEPGSYVETGQPLFSIVPRNVWVTANFKETQLKLMKVGQPVTIKIDAYGSHEFQGHVDSIQNGTGARFSLLPAENATGNWVKVVQRVPVKITFDNNEEEKTQYQLAPGLSVEPKVKVR
ncbi:MAG TPA: HlyD family secretion protein [Tepidisphaeraceae bacterium]